MKSNRIILSFLLLIAGCGHVSVDQIDYRAENACLKEQLAQAQATIEQKDRQIANLQALPDGVSSKITKVDQVDLGRYCRLVDDNNDLRAERLIVYLQLYDNAGDLVKVAGSVAVELWDLNLKGDNRIGYWQLSSDQFEDRWDGGFLAGHYRIELPMKGIEPAGERLTLKCVYTELLTGRSWETQKVINSLSSEIADNGK